MMHCKDTKGENFRTLFLRSRDNDPWKKMKYLQFDSEIPVLSVGRNPWFPMEWGRLRAVFLNFAVNVAALFCAVFTAWFVRVSWSVASG